MRRETIQGLRVEPRVPEGMAQAEFYQTGTDILLPVAIYNTHTCCASPDYRHRESDRDALSETEFHVSSHAWTRESSTTFLSGSTRCSWTREYSRSIFQIYIRSRDAVQAVEIR